ncbi:MAG TPA: PQQ-binding-like beta-propeller repeat protein [Planctomycetaceae bacterium]|jgi:outer membrane protein assembly factor BamB|nr:PQQ-binding-like beta-propeller repeat protein [Planctomycetaceae bacterium]
MSTAQTNAEVAAQPSQTPVARSPRVLRVWPAVAIAVAYWLAILVISRLDLVISTTFFATVITSVLTGFVFLIWLLSRRAIPGRDRLMVLFALVGGTVLVNYLSDASVGVMGILFAGPGVLCTAWAAWLLGARKWSPTVIRNGLLIVLALVWAQFTLVRINGVDGRQQASISLRWTRTPEELYLAEHASAAPVLSSQAAKAETNPTLVVAAGDWPDYRGANRQGELHGTKIATDWKATPPKLVWRQRIGPAWSSFVVLGNHLFTQEQRGEDEAVVCLDATSGKEQWVHLDKSRFSDGQAGAGPRSSPAFADGRIYSMGATGIVDCLDAATGRQIWSRNAATEAAAPQPMWGFSSSPLVAVGVVIVYAGGPGEKGLLAFRAKDGEPAWSVASGVTSYSSPQLVTLGKEPQVLFFSDAGLIAVDPASGKLRWRYDAPATQMWRVAQPRQIGDSSIILGCEDLGLVKLDLAQHDGTWTPTVAWKSQALHPAFNDFVYQDGFVYGIDKGLLCCVDAQTGTRRWKAGRYGYGQLLLLADQKLLFVISEYGDAALVSARPDHYEELTRFTAIAGKTWNHPVIARGRLYARNSEEIACYQLATPELHAARSDGESRTVATRVSR